MTVNGFFWISGSISFLVYEGGTGALTQVGKKLPVKETWPFGRSGSTMNIQLTVNTVLKANTGAGDWGLRLPFVYLFASWEY